jgi:hypothetical protein
MVLMLGGAGRYGANGFSQKGDESMSLMVFLPKVTKDFVVERFIALVTPLHRPLKRDKSLHYEIFCRSYKESFML